MGKIRLLLDCSHIPGGTLCLYSIRICPARAQQGDENALAALIARMMPAIRKGAAECTAPGLDFDDAVQEGLIGLFHAVRGFDPAAGQTFTAYAAACIRHAQQDARRAALRKSTRR